MTPIGGRKQSRRRMRKKRDVDLNVILRDVFGEITFGYMMHKASYWKADGPRRPLWRAK